MIKPNHSSRVKFNSGIIDPLHYVHKRASIKQVRSFAVPGVHSTACLKTKHTKCSSLKCNCYCHKRIDE